MRVFHVPQAYAPVLGGGEVLATRVSEGLASRGHAVHVRVADVRNCAAYFHPLRTSGIRPERETRGGVDVVRFPWTASWPRSWPWLRSGPIPFRNRLRALVRRRQFRRFAAWSTREARACRPDVVLGMMHTQPSMAVAVAVARELDLPLLLSPQHHEDAPPIVERALRRLLVHAHAVTANTTREAHVLEERFGVPRDAIVVTGGGTTLPSEAGGWPREPVVLYLGRLSTRKGLDTLFAALPRLIERVGEARLALVGARVPDTGIIDEAVAALPAALRSRVIAREDVSDAERDRWLRGARCLVLPSASESFGLVLVEAWGHGTPVVTLDLPVFRATVTPGENGLLVPPGDPASLAAALASLLEDPDHAARLGAAGRRTAEARHTWDAVVDRYEEALSLARRRQGVLASDGHRGSRP